MKTMRGAFFAGQGFFQDGRPALGQIFEPRQWGRPRPPRPSARQYPAAWYGQQQQAPAPPLKADSVNPYDVQGPPPPLPYKERSVLELYDVQKEAPQMRPFAQCPQGQVKDLATGKCIPSIATPGTQRRLPTVPIGSLFTGGGGMTYSGSTV